MRRLKGFMLIELLVVISVIALLMAILLPTLLGVRNRARAVVCRAHLKQWGTVLALYVEDNEGRIPAKRFLDPIWFFRGSHLREGDPNKPPVYHDLTTKGIACCPMAVNVSKWWLQTTWEDVLPFYNEEWTVVTRDPFTTFGAWEVVSPPAVSRQLRLQQNRKGWTAHTWECMGPQRGSGDILSQRPSQHTCYSRL